MSEFVINGGRRMSGSLDVQGSKNAALPIISAALLVKEEVALHNCPHITDVENALEILRFLGCKAERQGDTVHINCAEIRESRIPDEMMKKMRSSVIFMGAILARNGIAELSYPGGCRLGARPINYHIDGLRALGALVEERDNTVYCRRGAMNGADVHLPFPSVGATENILLASTSCKGTTRIYNAAREPEIADLVRFLRSCGIEVYGEGGPVLTVFGGKMPHGTEYRIMPDRIVAGTYLCTAAAAGGNIELCGAVSHHMEALTEKLEGAGCILDIKPHSIRLRCNKRIKGIDTVSTAPYPGFATDMQPSLMGLMSGAEGDTVFVENVFESRYNHIEALRRMGADIEVSGLSARVHGRMLHGEKVEALDLRGGAALVTAAVGAEGETVIGGSCYIDRGYEEIETALGQLGADIYRRQTGKLNAEKTQKS